VGYIIKLSIRRKLGGRGNYTPAEVINSINFK